jgi:putative MATE family efflux protein
MVFPVFMLMAMMSNGGIGSGVAAAVARAIGAGRKDDADALLFHAIVIAIVFGAAFTLGTIRGGPMLYRALGGRSEALNAALQYSNYLFAGAIPVWIVNLQAAALRGSGNVMVPAMVTLIGALVLIPASPLLIFGFGPVPRLGIQGAAIAFAVYYCGAMLFLLRYMASGRTGLTFKFVPLQSRLSLDILKVGIPTAVNAVLTNLTVILVTGAIGLFGTKALAAYGIASRLDYVMIPILFGLCTAVLTMVGVNIGAGQIARARKIAWTSSLVGLVLTRSIGMVVAIVPLLWLHLFSDDSEVLRLATIYLRIVAPAYAALGFGFVVSFAAQGPATCSGHSSPPSPESCSPPASAGSPLAISAPGWRPWRRWWRRRWSLTPRSASSRCCRTRSGVPTRPKLKLRFSRHHKPFAARRCRAWPSASSPASPAAGRRCRGRPGISS